MRAWRSGDSVRTWRPEGGARFGDCEVKWPMNDGVCLLIKECYICVLLYVYASFYTKHFKNAYIVMQKTLRDETFGDYFQCYFSFKNMVCVLLKWRFHRG